MPIFDLLDDVLGFQTGRGRTSRGTQTRRSAAPVTIFQNENGSVTQRESNQSPFLQQVFSNLGLDPEQGRVNTTSLNINSTVPSATTPTQGRTADTRRAAEPVAVNAQEAEPVQEQPETVNDRDQTSVDSLRLRLLNVLGEL